MGCDFAIPATDKSSIELKRLGAIESGALACSTPEISMLDSISISISAGSHRLGLLDLEKIAAERVP